MNGKTDKRRPEDRKAVEDNWPFPKYRKVESDPERKLSVVKSDPKDNLKVAQPKSRG